MSKNDNFSALFRQHLSGNPLDHQLAEIGARHKKQYEFITSPAPHLAFIGGRGSGKTWGGAIRALRAAYGAFGMQTPNLGMVTAPTYPLLRDSSLRTFYEVAEPFIASHNRSEGILTLKNRSEILWRSMDDPDRAVRGPSVSWWWGDEAAQYKPTARNLAVAMLRQFGKLGYEWLTTTPLGRNWLWQIYIRDHKEDAEYELITVSSYENAFLGEGVVDNFAQDYHGDLRRQEIGGEFIAYSGLVYPMFDIGRHVSTARGTGDYIVGVDFGYANPGVMLLARIDYDGKVWVEEEVYESGRTIDWWAERATQWNRQYGVTEFVCDPSGGGTTSGAGRNFIARLAQEPFIHAYGGNNERLPGINTVTTKLSRDLLSIQPRCVNLIREFESYQWRTNREGNFDESVVKLDDHALDALRYMVHTQRGVPAAMVVKWI